MRQRIFFKTAVLVWKCIHDVAPAYLQQVCLPVESVPGRPRLRSASTGCVELPRMLTSTGQRSFNFHDVAPAYLQEVCLPVESVPVWNSLPSALRMTEHVLTAAEGLSVWTVIHATRRRCGVL